MRFQMPETLDGLTLEQIAKLYDDAFAEATELNAIADDKITKDESDALIALVGHLDTISARKEELEVGSTAAAEALAAARGRLVVDEPAAEVEESEEESEVVEERELEVVTAGGAPRSFAARAAANAKTPEAPQAPEVPSKALSLVASANVPGFISGQELNDFDQLALAFMGRGKSFAGGAQGGKGDVARKAGVYSMSPNAQRFSVAQLVKPDTEFTITEKMSAEDQFDLIQRVAQESRLPGGGLIAAGGWCSPSEQIWTFCELETMDGLLSIPEMVARRGGVTWTAGPQLSDLLAAANFGFLQTEAQAEAGTVKPCYELECPDWDEVRLDAIGFCIKAGILTNTTYPELVRRVLQLGVIAHARRINAQTIARISAAIGAATVFTPVTGAAFSPTSDVLAAIELNAIRIREAHAMAIDATVEGIFPIWLTAVLRSELSRRTGVDLLNVTDQMLMQWFATRHVSAQFVRDYQAINTGAATTVGGTSAWTRFPDKVEFMLYPAGSFVRLGTPVIDLDAVYDTDGLTHNTYTAAFFEEGFGLLNACGTGVKVQVSLDNVNGATGYPAIGAVVAP